MKKSRAAKKSCVNCHFLQRRDRFGNGREFSSHWEDNEIENRKLDEVNGLARVPVCSQGVWDGGIDIALGSDDERLKRIVEQNRKDSCCFIKRDRSMSNDAAYRLWERRNENKSVRKKYWFSLCALVLTVLGITVSVLFGILGVEQSKWDAIQKWVSLLFK